MKKIIYILFFFYLLHVTVFAQDTTKTMDALIVYGEGFSFKVKEPKNWIGDIDNAAKYYSNIIFYESSEKLKEGGALIQVIAYTRHNENTLEDLKYDLETYKNDYPNIQFKEFEVEHEDYECFSKIAYLKDDFYQYITYINPGKEYKNCISIVMNLAKRDANKEEIKAYNKIIESLWVIE